MRIREYSGARFGAKRHICPSAHTLYTTLFARSDGRLQGGCLFFPKNKWTGVVMDRCIAGYRE
jgi:hypothetical protein